MSAWTDLVSKIYKENALKNPQYKLKNAMIDAKKIYRAATTEPKKMTKNKSQYKKNKSQYKKNKSRRNKSSRKK